MEALTAHVIEINRGTLHDGPGLRTTVFLKGCPLRCLWCQNPEGMPAEQAVWWEARACIGARGFACLECVAACPTGALIAGENGPRRDRDVCTVCGACVATCPAQAMTFTGQAWTLDALVKEVLKDADYYRAFGGGVTVSGGEPLSQYRFVAAFFARLRALGVHTALDTCGLASTAAFAAVLPHTDYVLFDIKLLDPDLHRQYTGHSNEVILRNLATVAETIRHSNGAMHLWIRTPLIPDVTATPDNIAAIGRYIHQHLADVTERWELCAFNSACKQKYDKLDQPWTYADYPLLEQRFIASLQEAALAAGASPDKLVISGLIAKS